MAFFRCFSSEFSTTMTWNCLGRNNMAKNEISINESQSVGSTSMREPYSGLLATSSPIRLMISPYPEKTP